MKAIVSGGAGFIGSHLVDALIARGDEVLIVDDLSTGRGRNIAGAQERGARLITADVTDLAAVERAIGNFGPDAVFHLAAQVDVRLSVEDPGLDVRVNVEGTVNLLEAARRAHCDRFVLASSCAVYGEPGPDALPLVVGSPVNPGSPYGQAKLAAEGYVSLYRELHGMNAASLRFGNVYGPRQGAIGEAGVVSIFSKLMISGGTPTVFGTGEQTRDFIYVGDVVEALLSAADKGASGAFNVGTGKETTVLELIQMLAIVAGRDNVVPEMAAPRAGEIDRMALDTTRASAELGWSPRTGLADGLRLTWEANARERHGPGRQARAAEGAPLT